MSEQKKSTTLLTLISGSEVHLPLKKKVIEAELFSQLITGKELIDKVKNESERYKIDISKECEEIKEKAYIRGFEEGFSKWAEMVASLEEEIRNVRRDVEKMVAPVALKAARKIVGKEMELNPELVIEIISNHLKSVAQNKKVTLWVSREDYALLDKNRETLKKNFEGLEAFSLRPREDVDRGGCVVETESGIINARFENQWALLEKAFEKLGKKEGKE